MQITKENTLSLLTYNASWNKTMTPPIGGLFYSEFGHHLDITYSLFSKLPDYYFPMVNYDPIKTR